MKISIYVGDLFRERKLPRQGMSKFSVSPAPALLTQERQPNSQQPEVGTQRLSIIQGVWKVLNN